MLYLSWNRWRFLFSAHQLSSPPCPKWDEPQPESGTISPYSNCRTCLFPRTFLFIYPVCASLLVLFLKNHPDFQDTHTRSYISFVCVSRWLQILTTWERWISRKTPPVLEMYAPACHQGIAELRVFVPVARVLRTDTMW